MAWDKKQKPPPDFCPGHYCFFWVPPGGSADMSGATFGSFEEAVRQRSSWTTLPQGGCGCSFGTCTRFDPVAGDRDLYEPHEQALEKDGLPWFYFIASADNVGAEFREAYLRESQVRWGKEN